MEPGPCASSPFEPCQARKGAALRRIPASAADRLGSMVGSHPILRAAFTSGESGPQNRSRRTFWISSVASMAPFGRGSVRQGVSSRLSGISVVADVCMIG